MPFDGGVIVGYVLAALGRQVTDRTLKELLDRLLDSVGRRLGFVGLDRVRSGDPEAMRSLDLAIRQQAAQDAGFARELEWIQHQLDTSGGRQIIGQIYAPRGTVAVGPRSTAIGRDYVYAPYEHPGDIRRAPGWVKVLYVIGTLVALAGFGLFGSAMFSSDVQNADPAAGFPPQIAEAAAVFFVGLVILMFAALGASLSRRRD